MRSAKRTLRWNAREKTRTRTHPRAQGTVASYEGLCTGSVRDLLTPIQAHERWAGVEHLVRDALRADPSSAHAWIMLAYALSNQELPRETYLPYARRAFDLADTATPQERYFITGSFHGMNVFSDSSSRNTDNPRELERALSAYEALFTIQPDHYYVQNNLQHTYRVLGRDHELALMQIRLAEARPVNVRFNTAAALSLLSEGNLAAARRTRPVERQPSRLVPMFGMRANGRKRSSFGPTWIGSRKSLVRRLRVPVASPPRSIVVRMNFRGRSRQDSSLLSCLGPLESGSRACRTASSLGRNVAPLSARLPVTGARRFERTTGISHHEVDSRTPIGGDGSGLAHGVLLPTGLLDEAERDIERYKGQIPAAALDTSFYPLLTGELELGRGQPGEAARLLRLWLGTRLSATTRGPHRNWRTRGTRSARHRRP